MKNKTINEMDDIHRIQKRTNNTSIPIVLYLLIIMLIGSIIFLIVDKRIIDSDLKLIVRMGLLCIIINMLIFTFISSSFSIIKIRQGIIGPKGLSGSKGIIGVPGKCKMCEPVPNTFGIEKNKNKSNEMIIPQKPLLSQMDLEDKKSGYYYIINQIFQDLIGCREKIVATEAEALLLLDTIKEEIGIRSSNRFPNEDEIKNYLMKIKNKADKGTDTDKSINYPLCYGVNYSI